MQSTKIVIFRIGSYTKITNLCIFCETSVFEIPRFSWWIGHMAGLGTLLPL
jgi:hypothetical protein